MGKERNTRRGNSNRRSFFTAATQRAEPPFLFSAENAVWGASGRLKFSSDSRGATGYAPYALLQFCVCVCVWGGVRYRYIAEVMDGARRRLRMLPGSVRKTEYNRKALAPGADGLPRWEFPTVWLMGNYSGYRQSISLPKTEEKRRINLAAVLQSPAKPIRGSGEQPPESPRQGEK